ncbi:MAG TPA: threonine synthase, partial [Acidimicrobiaceae bacterium]|nr:threonine synthase [Acidimicrobiaceae bacterium]
MRYVSTRGDAPSLDFADALLAGPAPDGGLYVPTDWPRITASDLRDFASLPYAEVAARVLAPFVEPSVDAGTIAELTHAAYAAFRHDDVVPVSP